MLRTQLQELFDIIELDEYHSANVLAKQLGVSEKTVRNRIKELKVVLKEHGGDIVSKARFGYKLIMTDEKKFKSFLQEESEQYIPETSQERNQFLLKYLIELDGYVKMDDLSEMLYISKSSLSRSIRSVEKIMNQYGVELERKPNYGIRVIGDEFDIRRLLCTYFIKRKSFEDIRLENEEKLMWMAKHIHGLLVKYDIHLTEVAFDNFTDYVYVGVKRMCENHFLKLDITNFSEIGIKERGFLKELVTAIETEYNVQYTRDEENYILLYLAGKQRIGTAVENDYNFVIREEIDQLALDMIATIKQEYHMDFQKDFELRMILNQHLAAMDIRIRYGLPLTNPMIAEIKKEYALPYEMALQATRVLTEYYQTEISEDEIGYIALVFALALEKKDSIKNKVSILVVCNSGKNFLKLMKHQYERSFDDYLDKIYVQDVFGLEKFDFSLVDYVFTTVPITKEVPCPIFEVGVFLGDNDLMAIASLLAKGSGNVLRKYYTPERFLTDIKAKDKNDILKEICNRILEQEDVGHDFYELVLEREKYAQMKYGNKIAIPHPNKILSDYTFVYVAVLPEEVLWNEEMVQVIFLTSVGRVSDSDRQEFYKSTAKFALNGDAVQALIEHPTYETLIELLQL
ncbi:MAG: PRD domain-containing protein [Lachnospiraceae bacterium]|nr:PRD domain-containing protein [Lachnospiraceae bacterium]